MKAVSAIYFLISSLGASAAVVAAPKPGVDFYRHTYFGEPHIFMPAPEDESCADLLTGWKDQVSSLQPNKDAGNCRFYKESRCFGESIDFRFPGHDNLPALPGRWNDNIESFRCFRD